MVHQRAVSNYPRSTLQSRVFFIYIPFNFQHFGCNWIHFAIANAFLPTSVINPRVSKSAHRCLLSSVQWLRLRRGERRCAKRPSGKRFKVESIQPKQSASSTTSIYGKQAAEQGGRLLRYMAIQHSFASSPWSNSQLRSWSRWVNSSRVVISMVALPPLWPWTAAGGAVV